MRIIANGSPALAFPSGEQDAGLKVTVASHVVDGDSVTYHVRVVATKVGYYLSSDFVQPTTGTIFEDES